MDAREVWQAVNANLMPQYGTSMHYPHCKQPSCTGCVSAVPFEEAQPKLDLAIFRKD
jgi:hypothetical protein